MNKNEKRAVIKYFWLKGYKAKQIFDEMNGSLGQEMAPSWTTVKNWVAEFKRGRVSVDDDKRTGRPKEATTLDNIMRIEKIIQTNRDLKVMDIANAVGISKERTHNILVNELRMRKRENGWERISENVENVKEDSKDGNESLSSSDSEIGDDKDSGGFKRKRSK